MHGQLVASQKGSQRLPLWLPKGQPVASRRGQPVASLRAASGFHRAARCFPLGSQWLVASHRAASGLPQGSQRLPLWLPWAASGFPGQPAASHWAACGFPMVPWAASGFPRAACGIPLGSQWLPKKGCLRLPKGQPEAYQRHPPRLDTHDGIGAVRLDTLDGIGGVHDAVHPLHNRPPW